MPYFLPVGPSVCKLCQLRAKCFITQDCSTCGHKPVNQCLSSASSFLVKITGWSSTFSGIIPLLIHIFLLCLQQYLLNAKPSLVSVNTTTFLRVSPEESLCIDSRKFSFESLVFKNLFFFSCACYISQGKDWEKEKTQPHKPNEAWFYIASFRLSVPTSNWQQCQLDAPSCPYSIF